MGTKIKLKSKGSWLPVDPKTAKEYMDKLRQNIKAKKGKRSSKSATSTFTHPVVQEFHDLINNDAVVRMNFTKMIDQVPGYYSEKNPDGTDAHGFYLDSIDEMLEMIDYILGTAPEYNDTDLVGFPINTILNWTMGVPAGAAAFRNEKVNAMFKKILAVWTDFLNSEQSVYVLDPETGSWRSQEALDQLKMEQYLADPAGEWPYQSWNEFFIRKFRETEPPQRPIYDGPNSENAIVAACDSGVYNIQFNTKLQDWFWVKSQPYSLWDMLANEDGKTQSDNDHFNQYVKPFEGGVVFQAFLSAFKYHRWHSPVSGTIKKVYIKDGTYYSATQSEGLDQASPDMSQGYIAHTAARALIFIEADNPEIGLMCVVTIGMAEVSSNIIENKDGNPINPGDHINKGDQLGYFQFGGSTHCLVFQKDVVEGFTDEEGEINKGDDINVRQLIAFAKGSSQ
jgi:phosphatidylserine decarboxylase